MNENSDVREKCDDFSFKCDALCKDFDDRTRENSELIVEINDVKKKLDAEMEAHRQIHEYVYAKVFYFFLVETS